MQGCVGFMQVEVSERSGEEDGGVREMVDSDRRVRIRRHGARSARLLAQILHGRR